MAEQLLAGIGAEMRYGTVPWHATQLAVDFERRAVDALKPLLRVHAPATSAPGLGSPGPHLRRDWAYPARICAGTGLAFATFAPGLCSPPQEHLHREWARRYRHICTGTGPTPRALWTGRAPSVAAFAAPLAGNSYGTLRVLY